MTKSTSFLAVIIVALACVGFAIVTDMLVMTDEERLEAFVSDLTGPTSHTRLDVALNNSDPGRIPVELVAAASAERYEDGDHERFAERAREAFAPLLGEKAELLEKSITIEGDRALVAVRVSTDAGLVNARFRFVRCDDGWLVDQMSVL